MADQEHHTDQVKNPHEHRRHIQELPTTMLRVLFSCRIGRVGMFLTRFFLNFSCLSKAPIA